MTAWMIIADDLTGAIDAGVHFAGKGMITEVIPDFIPGIFPDYDLSGNDVLVINTESRHVEPALAAERVSLAARFALDSGISHIYKKTDSTLRGNIGAELEALLTTTGRKYLPFIPAYPALKRYTRKGIHFVGDQQIHQSHFAADPLEPIVTSYVPDILGKQSGCKTTVLSFPFRNNMACQPEFGQEILVYDCSSEGDLKDIEQNLEHNDLLGMVAGSAAVGCMLAGRLASQSGGIGSIETKGPSLLINGSLNPVTLEQVRLADSPWIIKFFLEPFFLNSETPDKTKRDELLRQIIQGARKGFDILVNSAGSREELDQFFLSRFGPSVPAPVYAHAAELFGEFIAETMNVYDFEQIVVMGGDTLMAMIRAMDIRTIRPLTEILPGVVISEVFITGKKHHLITKPGGYGSPDTLIELLEYINNRK
jgi:uncharacterized protein YgbK (DUF1537 family)